MARRVFLHVGAPKTGTTYLQQVLWSNRSALRRAEFLLPGTRKAHYQAMGDLRRGIWHDPDAWWTWDRLVAKARSWDGTVVVSEEMLGAATAEQAARAVDSLAPAEVHVVVAGRDLWRAIPSSWQQAVRSRGVGRFSDYVRALESGAYPSFWEHQTPLPILRRWAADLPPTQRHLVTVPPIDADAGLLWTRFAGTLGIPDGVCAIPSAVGHQSLGATETELLRRVNVALGDRYPLRGPYMQVVHRHLLSPVLNNRPRGERLDVPPEFAEWLTRRTKQMVEDLYAFPCQVAGDLTDLAPTAGRTAEPHVTSDAELLDVAVETIVGMLRHAETLAGDLDASVRRSTRERRRVALAYRRFAGQAADRLRRLARR